MPAKSSRSAKSKSASSQVRALVQMPGVQYTAVFVAAYAAFLIAGLIASAVPIFELFPMATNVDTTSAYYLWYSLGITTAQALLPAILFGVGFWLFGRGLIALGAKQPKRQALWLGAAATSVLFLLLIISTSLLSVLGDFNLSPNSQTIYDLVTIPLLGVFYAASWWLVRSRH